MSEPPGRSFSASYDTSSKIVSAVCAGLLIAIPVFTENGVAAIFLIPILLAIFAWSPRSYFLDGRTLRVRRLIGAVPFPLDELQEARRATAADLSGCIRLFGSGGVFGYYGLFRTSKLGRCTWYVTDRDNSVVLVTPTKTALFSPDDPDGFLSAVGAPVSLPTVPSSRAMPTSGIPLALKIGIAALVLAVAAICFVAFAYAPGPPSYTLSPTSLAIHDRFYPVTLQAGSVDLDHVRLIDLTSDPGWIPNRRTNGFANAHYQSGWYHAANGKKIRMYRAGSQRMVLLPPIGDGAPVLLEVADPDAFLLALHQHWAASLP